MQLLKSSVVSLLEQINKATILVVEHLRFGQVKSSGWLLLERHFVSHSSQEKQAYQTPGVWGGHQCCQEMVGRGNAFAVVFFRKEWVKQGKEL